MIVDLGFRQTRDTLFGVLAALVPANNGNSIKFMTINRLIVTIQGIIACDE
ncbi:hypothetical protein [Brasilonema sennae]|uniref:hypothetical protein n=1 Tax=Brasilonema sennae TaxID=1397703 RepID=UPI00155A178D|nr:hypothetical protein [Brasilonema sennae]